MSLVMVTKGPALIAGSIFALKNSIGAVDPMIAAMLTANIIPAPTTAPSSDDE